MGALRHGLNPASNPTNRDNNMVGTNGNQSPKGATTTIQRGGDIHDVEYLEGNKQKDFPRRGHGCSTSGLESQGRH